MAYLLDTNAWIQLLKHRTGKVATRLTSVPADEILTCSVVKAELWHGARKYSNMERRLADVERLLSHYTSLPFDDAAAHHYADIRHQLETQGSVIGPNDLKIAAIARLHNLTLVSSGEEFSRVVGLRVENWT